MKEIVSIKNLMRILKSHFYAYEVLSPKSAYTLKLIGIL